MHKTFNRIIALLAIIMMVGVYVMPVGVYAANEIKQNTDTKEENVKFNATINGAQKTEVDINSVAVLELALSVLESGYLKDVRIALNNCNYKVGEITDENVKLVNNNELELNEVNSGEELKARVPIIYEKKEVVAEEDFERESEVKLIATYVDSKGKEKEIEKTLTENLTWKSTGTEVISQQLVRYIKYENKTMVTFEVKDGIQDNTVPLKNKEISIIVPKIENTTPEKVIVNGKGIKYKYENGIISISKNMMLEDGKFSWNSEDTYNVTYIYNNQTNAESISTSANVNVITINNNNLQGVTENNEYKTSNEIGSLVELKTDGTKQLSKGYMHTNSKKSDKKLDTTFKTVYNINIGYAEVIDKIVAREDTANYNNVDGNSVKEAVNDLKTTKVRIDGRQLVSILGENGTITVKDENDKILGELNKNATELSMNANKLSFEISKPITEGIISIETDKAIKGEAENSKDEINEFKFLELVLKSEGYNENQKISDSNTNYNIKLTEATSKAYFDTNKDSLSTIVKNENVAFNVVLSKKDINDALYTNPTVKLRLPEQVTGIEVISGNLLYENELKPGNTEVTNNEIIVNFEGAQTEYNSSTTVDGALLRVETNLTLNNLAPSSIEKIQLECVNEYTGEVVTAEKEVKIVAPTGFVTTNTIKVDDKEVTAVENDADLIRLKTAETAKTMVVEANLVNNIGTDAEGLIVIGRIPTAGNKTVGEIELGSNIETRLATPVELYNLENATIYYSSNINEEVDGNGWTTEATAESKSFKIVANAVYENRKMASFKYAVEIPAYLDYGQVAKENYGVYYNNNAQEGVSRNLVESRVAGITTGSAPDIKAEITAFDTNDGHAIENGSNVTEGEFVTYKLQLSNTGSNEANNVKLTTVLSEALALVQKETIEGQAGTGYTVDSESKVLEQAIGTLKGGESKTFYFDAMVNQKLSSVEDKENSNVQIGFAVEADILEERIEKIYSAKNTEGSLNAKLATNVNGSVLPNENYNYVLTIYNANYNDKENVTATIKLPNGVRFDRLDSEDEVNYNERTNELTVKVGSIIGGENRAISINVVNNSNDEELKATATVKADGTNSDIKSNEVAINNLITDKSIKATQTSNISNEIMDSDKLEYYIDIKNISKETITVNVKDIIPDELIVNKYLITVDGQEIYSSSTSYINNDVTIPAGKDAKVVISTTPLEIEKANRIDIVNKPVITNKEGEEIKVNELKTRIVGSKEVEKEEVVEEGNIENSEPEVETKKYRINGTAWFDKNKNGQRDSEEPSLKGINLVLYSSATKDVLRDGKGNEVQTTTGEDGNYVFSDIDAGEYVVVAQYNSDEYQISGYKEKQVAESTNSDFVAVKMDGIDYATTDLIRIENENVYGIDLGLSEKDKFDLEIKESISKITVINSDNQKIEYNYDIDKAKVELSDEEVRNSTLLIEYNINVKNVGNTEGYAKSIVNHIPKGLTFNSEYNKDWYLAKDGNLYTVSLANTKILPGKDENIKLVMVKRVKEDNVGIIRGQAEINSTYNEKGLEEINALSSRKANVSAADVIVARKTRFSALTVLSITVALTTLFSIIVYQMKKIIDKQYDLND